jgi:hypothetical protein
MAKIEKTAELDYEILLWDLWERPEAPTVNIKEIDRIKLASYGVPVAIYSAISLAVMLPLLWPGYILTLDMVFTPQLRMPDTVSSSYLFHSALHYLNMLLPSDIIQKIMLLAILLTSALGMHYLVRYAQNPKDRANEFGLWGAYIAGFVYAVNPFTYSRFMSGQYAVLLGYALLPIFLRVLMQFFAVPTLKRGLIVGIWMTLIGILSIHTLALAGVLIVGSLAVGIWKFRKNITIIFNAFIYSLAGLSLFLVASGYWLLPLLLGSSNQSLAVAGFSSGDQAAFATIGNGITGKLGNILQLQGFWAEGQGLYILPQDSIRVWPVVVVIIWVIIGFGIKKTWREYRATSVLLLTVGLTSIILALTGVGGAGLLSGLREPHKLLGLLALTYAFFAGFGTAAILTWGKKHGQIVLTAISILVLILPVLYTPTMFWGFSGQLSPRQYPDDWQMINSRLNQDADNFKVLSLPWHLYMHYQFSGRIIANPSEHFFDKPFIASNQLEFKNASPTFPDATKSQLNLIVPYAADSSRLGDVLDKLDIKYILLTKTFDYKDYAYLDKKADLKIVSETPNLKLYRNLAYGK